MSTLRLVLCWAFVSSCVLPVLPQTNSNFVCDQFTITPLAGPDNPLVIPEGGSQTVTCKHESIGLQAVDWYRDASVIQEDVSEGAEGCSCRFAPLDETPESRELTFTNFAQESAGIYSCRVPVPFMPGVFNICQFNVLIAERPTVQNLPQSRTYNLTTGRTLHIPANVSGLPKPTIAWGRNSMPLPNDNRFTVDQDTGALTVTGVTPADRGNYSLTLTNSAGTLATYISVFVQFVEITRITNPVTTVDNEIMVTCSGRGYPSVIVEWEDSSNNIIQVGTEVVSSSQSTFERTSMNTLTIQRASCQDPYTCIVRSGASLSTRRTISICTGPAPPPRPMNVLVVQNGMDSVRVTWSISNADQVESYRVLYRSSQGGTDTVVNVESTSELSVTIRGLARNVEYSFRVASVRQNLMNESAPFTVILAECSQNISNKVLGVSIGTAVNTNGQRTFNISWTEPQENIVTGYKVMTDQGWVNVVNPKIVTNLVTPANFCNGQDHKFFVMATNNCGVPGPQSATVVGNCDTLSSIRISSVTAYGTAVAVKWNLKSGTSILPPLTITVLEIQLNSNGQQVQLNYSISDIADEAECLGDLKNSTRYMVCLHPIYTNGMPELEPICMEFTTKVMESEANIVGSCTKPTSRTLVGSPVSQIPIPDYAIALIAVGAVIIVALVFCFIGLCFACNNSRSKEIDDLGSEYSSTIGVGMQGRLSSNHNRNMSPTRSCLSYHSKGHSTNWNDHMGTLREMETEVGTNV